MKIGETTRTTLTTCGACVYCDSPNLNYHGGESTTKGSFVKGYDPNVHWSLYSCTSCKRSFWQKRIQIPHIEDEVLIKREFEIEYHSDDYEGERSGMF